MTPAYILRPAVLPRNWTIRTPDGHLMAIVKPSAGGSYRIRYAGYPQTEPALYDTPEEALKAFTLVNSRAHLEAS